MMADPSGRIIPLPIRSNFREGLTTLEYFISTHGSRKGLADTALRTADAGYLTRRLVDVAQDIIIAQDDCGTDDGIWLRDTDDVAGQSLGERVFGRVAARTIADPESGEVIVKKGNLISHSEVRQISRSGVKEAFVRSPLTCIAERGVCSHCYGMDMGRGKLVVLGAAVGIVAAQSIGEPGTQLTLRTFHTGGVAGGTDITTGLPRVEELFEARRTPKGEAVVAEIGGRVEIIYGDGEQRQAKITFSEMINDEYALSKGWKAEVKDAGKVKEGDVLATGGDDTVITASNAGKVRIEGDKIIVAYERVDEEVYDIPANTRLAVREGDDIEAGTPLTEGSLNPHVILRVQGREATQKYLLTEVQQVYRSQGQNIHDKHFEVIIRKMLSKVIVTQPGSTNYLPGDYVDRLEILKSNEEILAEGGTPAKYINDLLGITKASLNTESFLSAASFQHTIKVLSSAAVGGSEDPLHGLKENVILGKLIPAGTGYAQHIESLHPGEGKLEGNYLEVPEMAPPEPVRMLPDDFDPEDLESLAAD
jgi:DNA-directed RNA polymerase subunit beta'